MLGTPMPRNERDFPSDYIGKVVWICCGIVIDCMLFP